MAAILKAAYFEQKWANLNKAYILSVAEAKGWDIPEVYVSLGEVYKNIEEAEKADPDMFNPNLVNACREQDVARHIAKQKQVLEDDCWGD